MSGWDADSVREVLQVSGATVSAADVHTTSAYRRLHVYYKNKLVHKALGNDSYRCI